MDINVNFAQLLSSQLKQDPITCSSKTVVAPHNITEIIYNSKLLIFFYDGKKVITTVSHLHSTNQMVIYIIHKYRFMYSDGMLLTIS